MILPKWIKIHKNRVVIQSGSKYCCEHQDTCYVFIILTYLMASKLIYLLVDCEILNYLLVLKQVTSVCITRSNIYDGDFSKNSWQHKFRPLNFSRKKFISDAWLGLKCSSAGESVSTVNNGLKSSRYLEPKI